MIIGRGVRSSEKRSGSAGMQRRGSAARFTTSRVVMRMTKARDLQRGGSYHPYLLTRPYHPPLSWAQGAAWCDMAVLHRLQLRNMRRTMCSPQPNMGARLTLQKTRGNALHKRLAVPQLHKSRCQSLSIKNGPFKAFSSAQGSEMGQHIILNSHCHVSQSALICQSQLRRSALTPVGRCL